MKPFQPPEGNELKISTDGNKGKVPNPKKCRGKKPQNKPIPEPEFKTDFQGRCTNLEGYIFDPGQIVSKKIAQTMK